MTVVRRVIYIYIYIYIYVVCVCHGPVEEVDYFKLLGSHVVADGEYERGVVNSMNEGYHREC